MSQARDPLTRAPICRHRLNIENLASGLRRVTLTAHDA